MLKYMLYEMRILRMHINLCMSIIIATRDKPWFTREKVPGPINRDL